MKKYPIGFNTRINKEPEINVPMEVCKGVIEPKKSVVQVYFPHRGMGWAYYNDSFDLKVGDFVYVEGKLEGYRGQVTEVNYSFKIKLSDYKKVIAVIDTNVEGDFYLAGSHVVCFDRNAIPFSKVLTWFKAPENDGEYVSGNDDTNRFPLDRISIWKAMKSLCESAGVEKEKVFPHNLRHLFARTYYSLQKDIVRLADILGHSSINTTRIYTIEDGDIHRRQMQRLGLVRMQN